MKNKKKRIILAPPYSGTLYAYFNNCIKSSEMEHLNHMSHPYYNKLYGMYTEQSKDIALTLSILYDEIIIPPADAYFPKDGLGFYIDWNKYISFTEKREYEINECIKNPKLTDLFMGQEDYEKKRLLSELSYCIHLSTELNCPIFCGKGTKKVIDKISTIESSKISNNVSNKIVFIENYLNLSLFAFNATNLDIFEKIKYDSSVRSYCNKFIKILEKQADTVTTEADLKKLIQEYQEKTNIYQHTKGVFHILSSIFNFAGFIPLIGTPFSLASLGFSGGEKLISRIQPDWYELAPEIGRVSISEFLKKNVF